MPFQLLPIIETMIAFYQQPRSFDRFQQYLKLLHGNTKADLIMPIGGFNPMAKDHVLEKLMQLKLLGIEEIIDKTLVEVNNRYRKIQPAFKVAFNVADDLHGAWTNRFTADYDNKFKLNGLINRNFCAPIFWSGEDYSAGIIKERTLEYCYRTIYWLTNPNPKTLAEHILQETAIAKNIEAKTKAGVDFEAIDNYYQTHATSTNYQVIFNFLYGDAASVSLGNAALGIKEPFAGFKYAAWLATK